MSFNDFFHIYQLKKKATSDTKNQNNFSSRALNDLGICLKDGPLSIDVGIVNVHLTKGSHWVAYLNKNYFDSYGGSSPQKLSKFIIKRNGFYLYSEYEVQGLIHKRDAYCASCCLYLLCLKKVLGTDFKTDVLNSSYQLIQYLWRFL